MEDCSEHFLKPEDYTVSKFHTQILDQIKKEAIIPMDHLNWIDVRLSVSRTWLDRPARDNDSPAVKRLKDLAFGTSLLLVTETLRPLLPLTRMSDPLDTTAGLVTRLRRIATTGEVTASDDATARREIEGMGDSLPDLLAGIYGPASDIRAVTIFLLCVVTEVIGGISPITTVGLALSRCTDIASRCVSSRPLTSFVRCFQRYWIYQAYLAAQPVSWNPDWNTSTVVALARGIFDDLAFDRMPILADALMDAGCCDDDLLTRLRSPGVFTRADCALCHPLGYH